MPPTAAATDDMVVPPAIGVAVADGVSGPPLMTVTSGLAVALGIGLGASTHVATFSPPSAATLVVQKEFCAKALDASPKTTIKDNEVKIISLFINAT
jgi:hypothetical protein